MARLTGALFSLAASGTIADTLTFAKWKGIQYVRTRVIPANPRADGQREVRGVFITLNELWKRMPALGRAPFAAAAAGQPFTDRNKHIGENVKILRDDGNFSNYVWSVQGGQALPSTGMVCVGAVGNISVRTMVAPDPPEGYAFLKRVAGAIIRGDPSVDGGIIRTMYCAESLVNTVNFTITCPAETYRVGAWVGWTRLSDGKVFYSTFEKSGALVA